MGRIRRKNRKGDWKVGKCTLHKRKYVFAEKWAYERHMRMHHKKEVKP